MEEVEVVVVEDETVAVTVTDVHVVVKDLDDIEPPTVYLDSLIIYAVNFIKYNVVYFIRHCKVIVLMKIFYYQIVCAHCSALSYFGM